MTDQKRYFFCGIGGSGMLPLAMILRGQGAEVSGSDRALDQGRTPEKFDWLRAQSISLFPQDGTGLVMGDQILVASAAVEDTVPDVAAANLLGCTRMTRAELLSQLFNGAGHSIGVAGTSGKSTTTAMIAWILSEAGKAPTVMNGAVMKNFASQEAPFASALVSGSDLFVSEVDESDGSIAKYDPSVAVLNNISLDHKSMDELRDLFGGFIERADTAVLNADDAETIALRGKARAAVTYSLESGKGDLWADEIVPGPTSIGFRACTPDAPPVEITLPTPGRHNVSNALAAMAAARICGVSLSDAGKALARFAGIKRRFEIVGETSGVTVIDDFGHNPDKITATLSTLRDFPGRLIVMWQPHGFGPLRKMRRELADAFVGCLTGDDILIMPEPVYFGGTVDRSVSSADLAGDVQARGITAEALETREACGAWIVELAQPGDRIIVMGARDDTLSEFARSILQNLQR